MLAFPSNHYIIFERGRKSTPLLCAYRIVGMILGIGPFLSDYDLAQCMEKMATYTPVTKDFWRCILSFNIYTLISIYIGIHRFKEKDIYNL